MASRRDTSRSAACAGNRQPRTVAESAWLNAQVSSTRTARASSKPRDGSKAGAVSRGARSGAAASGIPFISALRAPNDNTTRPAALRGYFAESNDVEWYRTEGGGDISRMLAPHRHVVSTQLHVVSCSRLTRGGGASGGAARCQGTAKGVTREISSEPLFSGRQPLPLPLPLAQPRAEAEAQAPVAADAHAVAVALPALPLPRPPPALAAAPATRGGAAVRPPAAAAAASGGRAAAGAPSRRVGALATLPPPHAPAQTSLLVRNLPRDTQVGELRDLMARFGA